MMQEPLFNPADMSMSMEHLLGGDSNGGGAEHACAEQHAHGHNHALMQQQHHRHHADPAACSSLGQHQPIVISSRESCADQQTQHQYHLHHHHQHHHHSDPAVHHSSMSSGSRDSLLRPPARAGSSKLLSPTPSTSPSASDPDAPHPPVPGPPPPSPQQALKCPRCESTNTKFCYFNNYNSNQPRHFCKNCRRYWTQGGALRNVPPGGGCRKNKRAKQRLAVMDAGTIEDSASDMLASINSTVGCSPLFPNFAFASPFGDPNSPMLRMALGGAAAPPEAMLRSFRDQSRACNPSLYEMQGPPSLHPSLMLNMPSSFDSAMFSMGFSTGAANVKSEQEAGMMTYHAGDLFEQPLPIMPSATATLASLEEQLTSFSNVPESLNLEPDLKLQQHQQQQQQQQQQHHSVLSMSMMHPHDDRSHDSSSLGVMPLNMLQPAEDRPAQEPRPFSGFLDVPNDWQQAAGLTEGSAFESHQAPPWLASKWQNILCRQDQTPLLQPCTSTQL